MKGPSRQAFEKAIDASGEANMIHLEAMAKERYAIFLGREKYDALAKQYVTSSYWLYQDWGAHAKALQLSQQYEFLKHSKRCNAQSSTQSSATITDDPSRQRKTVYLFNTTLRNRKRISL
mmetsp:Transcript_12289/g.21305  ORF Transcript_12289/g.21305 Transcript_12289/m.21305 type:complete len:120 (-) Transcript_12289:126-485(-)